jgi:hypothetical protein
MKKINLSLMMLALSMLAMGCGKPSKPERQTADQRQARDKQEMERTRQVAITKTQELDQSQTSATREKLTEVYNAVKAYIAAGDTYLADLTEGAYENAMPEYQRDSIRQGLHNAKEGLQVIGAAMAKIAPSTNTGDFGCAKTGECPTPPPGY